MALTKVKYEPTGTGAIPRTLESKAQETVSVTDFGAVRDGTTQTTIIQKAIDAVAGAGNLSTDGGFVDVPKGVVVDATALTLKDNVTLRIDDGQTIKTIQNGQNVSGAVNEHWNVSGFHPSYNLDAHDDYTGVTLGTGQALSYRASFLYYVNGIGNWQIAQDIDATKSKGLTFYALTPSKQVLHLDHSGSIRYGRRASIQDFSTPLQKHVFNGNIDFEDDDTNTLSMTLKLVQPGVVDSSATVTHQKIIQLQSFDGELTILDDAAAAFIFRLADDGKLRTTKGVSGGAFTTAARNALTGWVSADIGTMVYDSTLGKPIWLKTTTPTWVDATGTAV